MPDVEIALAHDLVQRSRAHYGRVPYPDDFLHREALPWRALACFEEPEMFELALEFGAQEQRRLPDVLHAILTAARQGEGEAFGVKLAPAPQRVARWRSIFEARLRSRPLPAPLIVVDTLTRMAVQFHPQGHVTAAPHIGLARHSGVVGGPLVVPLPPTVHLRRDTLEYVRRSAEFREWTLRVAHTPHRIPLETPRWPGGGAPEFRMSVSAALSEVPLADLRQVAAQAAEAAQAPPEALTLIGQLDRPEDLVKLARAPHLLGAALRAPLTARIRRARPGADLHGDDLRLVYARLVNLLGEPQAEGTALLLFALRGPVDGARFAGLEDREVWAAIDGLT